MGTCDLPLCNRCTTSIAGDGDLCRAHAPLWDMARGRAKVGPGAEEVGPTQKVCPDCGEPGERKGHQACQYPQDDGPDAGLEEEGGP